MKKTQPLTHPLQIQGTKRQPQEYCVYLKIPFLQVSLC